MGPVDQGLWAACVVLARDQGLARVRVADICRHASVHRSTFYRHFEDKQDLVERGTARLVFEMASEAPSPHESVRSLQRRISPGHLVRLFVVARTRRDQLAVVLDPTRGFPFRAALQAAFVELGAQRLHELGVDSSGPSALVAHFSAAGIVECLAWWVERGCVPEPTAMAGWVAAYLAEGALGPLGLDRT